MIVPLLAVAAGSPLLDAKVCSAGGYENIGLFIGQTKDAVYLGERPPPDQPRARPRLLSTPLDETEQIFLGHRAVKATCDHQVDSETFIQIIDRLGSEDLNVRTGSIYALGKIANSSTGEPYRQSIARMIIAYVRAHSAWPNKCDVRTKSKPSSNHKPLEQVNRVFPPLLPQLQDRQPDVYAATRVLAEWDADIRVQAVVDLQGLDLRAANLYGANFSHHVLLSDAHLELADLGAADLSGAALINTSLIGANLTNARLNEAVLLGADLRGADISGADLSNARVDSGTLLEEAISDERTIWPHGYNRETAKASGVSTEDRKALVCTYFDKPEGGTAAQFPRPGG